MSGWLCGIEDAARGMFADTEDWIAYRNFEGTIYEVELTDAGRKDQVAVEVYKGGEWVQNVAWNAEAERFVVDNIAFETDTDYQLRLTTTAVTNGFSYFFGGKELA